MTFSVPYFSTPFNDKYNYSKDNDFYKLVNIKNSVFSKKIQKGAKRYS